VRLGHQEGLNSRRGSVPCDLLGRGLVASKTRRSKKLLRRRSSGGPEMFASGADGNDNGSWSSRSRRDLPNKREVLHVADPTPLLAKRRGSLPIDMLALSFSGRYIHR
jgi:cAMP-specific phosphodiesterase 4